MDIQQLDRFMASIVPDANGCWRRDRSLNHHGYSIVSLRCRQSGKRYWLAHRVTYEVFVADVPEGQELDHLCRNRWCVNPTHLEPVAPKENTARGLLGALLTPDVRRRLGDRSRGKQRPWTPEWKDRLVAAMRRERASRTHCLRGHLYDEENTYICNGRRSCAACRRDYYWRKKREAA